MRTGFCLPVPDADFSLPCPIIRDPSVLLTIESLNFSHVFQLYLVVAFTRAAGNTSNGLECPAFGGIDIEWATEDFTRGDVQKPQWTVVLDVEEVPAPSLIPVFPPSLGVFFSQR